MVRCQAVIDAMNRIAPKKLAEEWDNPGLLVGNPRQEIERVLLCLDVSDVVIEQAVKIHAGLIISHHPMIFRPMKAIRTDLPTGRRIEKLLRNGISVFAAHTNLDCAWGGVNDVLAEQIGLTDIVPFERSEEGEEGMPSLGRMGILPESMTARAFAEKIRDCLPTSYVRLTEAGSHPVRKVALCSGSGAEFIAKAAFLGADAYVTGDVRYHDAQRAVEEGIHVIDAGHFGTEFPVVHALKERLEQELGKLSVSVELVEDISSKDFFSVI